VLGDPETMLTAAQVLSAAFARPGDVLRKDSVDITGLHAVAQLHPQRAGDGPAVAVAVAAWLYGDLTDDGRGPIDPSRAAAALHAAVHELRDRHLSQPVVWAPLVHVGR